MQSFLFGSIRSPKYSTQARISAEWYQEKPKNVQIMKKNYWVRGQEQAGTGLSHLRFQFISFSLFNTFLMFQVIEGNNSGERMTGKASWLLLLNGRLQVSRENLLWMSGTNQDEKVRLPTLKLSFEFRDHWKRCLSSPGRRRKLLVPS